MDSGRWPRYMASGMGCITFAKTEPHLFSMLFMCVTRAVTNASAWSASCNRSSN